MEQVLTSKSGLDNIREELPCCI